MSESVDERVSELLEVAHDVEGEAVDEEALEAAREASELVRETDPGRLLEAVDLPGTDGGGPETLPEAIATAESEAVEDLHALLEFAKLADDDGERTDEGGERAEEGDEAVESAESRDETESRADSSEASEDDLQTQLRESMQSAFDDFGEDVTGLRDHLEELTDDEDDDVEDDQEKADDPRADDERRTDEDDEVDGDTAVAPSQHSTRLSTMAPPPSDRVDMRAVSRYSTMPSRQSRR